MCGMLRCIFRISVAENRSDNLGCRSELGSDPPTTAAGKSLGLHIVCQLRKSHVGKSFKTRLTGDFYNHGAQNHLASIGNAMQHETTNPRNIICKYDRLGNSVCVAYLKCRITRISLQLLLPEQHLQVPCQP
jgi:hypothetical protein